MIKFEAYSPLSLSSLIRRITNVSSGIKMGETAGYHWEVCIDKLEFNEDGTIKPVQPTH
jgi:hypothetical protein